MAALGLRLVPACSLSHGRVGAHPDAIPLLPLPLWMNKLIHRITTHGRRSCSPGEPTELLCVCRSQHGQDEAVGRTMPSCIPSSSPTLQPVCCDRGCLHRVPGALRDLPALNPHRPGMASLIVVTEYDTTGSVSEEEMNVSGNEGFGDSQEPRAKLHLSGRKLSLQERSQPARSPGSSDSTNERFIYPSLPYSPVTSPHSSPRLPRRPTVESNRVSITGLQVRGDECFYTCLFPCGIASCLAFWDQTPWHFVVGGGGTSCSILGYRDSPGEVGANSSPHFVPVAYGTRLCFGDAVGTL